MSLNLDVKARERVKATLAESHGGRSYRAICLQGGGRLLLAAHAGALVYALLDGADDFSPNVLRDITLDLARLMMEEQPWKP